MIKLIKVKAILFVVVFFAKNSFANSDFYVPETVSEEAKSIIHGFVNPDKKWPSENDLIGWEKEKIKYNSYVTSLNKEALLEFNPILEDDKINGVPVLWITPKNVTNENLIIYIHGGAFTLFNAKSSLYNIIPFANAAKTKVISVDYTTAPNKKWDEITDEVISVISGLYDMNYSNKKIVLFGDSAGGALAASSILKMKDKNLKTPSALVLWSPWADVTETGDTYITLKDAETSFSYNSLLSHAASAYADSKDQKNPYVSPVYGNFDESFPPTLIQGGTKELFMSNFIRLYQKIDQAGSHVKLDLYEGMWHVFQSYWNIPESKIAIGKSVEFIKENVE